MNRNASIGAAVWLAFLAVARMRWIEAEWIDLLFLLAPLVVVPLGLQLMGEMEKGVVPSTPERVARDVQLACALAVVASFLLPRGAAAGLLVAAWFVFCGMLAVGGLIRLARGAFRSFDSIFAVFAFFYLPIGAAWLTASRLGIAPLGFQEPIVLLTAVHFHYAGFAAPLLARSSRRALVGPPARSVAVALLNVLSTGVVVGPGLLAAGFVIGPRVKLAAAVVLAASEVGLAVSFISALKHVARRGPKCLIGLAAASLGFAMMLAALWAIGEYPLQPFVHLAEMARFHGTANAFGFTLCGLIGWTQAQKCWARSGGKA